MSEYLDRLHRADGELTAVILGIEELANAFTIVGNRKVADKLWDMAQAIQDAAKEIRSATTEELNRQVKQAQESSANLVRAALAGSALEGGKKI